MKIRKNLITILLVLSTIMLVCSTNVSNAADNAKIGLTADKTEAVAGDTVKITVKVKDITGITDGIIGLQGNLVYDNTIFESVTFANLNNWDKPDYNETNGSFLTSKGDFVKNDEDVFTISLKLKSDAKLGDTKVQLKDIQVADLDKEYTSTGAEITIKVVEKSITDDDKGNSNDKGNTDNGGNSNDKGNTDNGGNSNDKGNTDNGGNSNDKESTDNDGKSNGGSSQDSGTPTTGDSTTKKTDDTISKGVLPKTGLNGNILVIAGMVFVLIGAISYSKYKDYKKIK
jgi:LPXTG-motif cell wall-anchored protein